MNTGCPRTQIHETALQLLQILDHRFFGSISPLGMASNKMSKVTFFGRKYFLKKKIIEKFKTVLQIVCILKPNSFKISDE